MNNELAKVYTGDFALSPDACWIHACGAEPTHWYVLRREFDACGESTVLALGACHYAEAYINGALVMRFCERAYHFDIKYKCADISPFVKEGKNTLVIIMDKMFDENRRSDVIVQINCGESVVLVSDGRFRTAEYAPMSAGANFFIEGPHKCEVFDARKDVFLPAFVSGFDDSAWAHAECAREESARYSLARPAQDKNEMQTNTPVFAKNYVSFEKSEPQKGISAKITPENGGIVLCETEIFAENAFSFAVENLGGAVALSLDGEVLPFGAEKCASAGGHRLALVGHTPKVFVKGEGFTLGKWKKAEPLKREAPKKRPPRFPWNDIASEEKLPEKLYCFLASKVPLATCDAGETAYELNAAEKLKYKEYISCADSVTDEKLEKAAQRRKTAKMLGVLGRESIFAPEGEMKIAPSKEDVTFILDFGRVRIGGIYLSVSAPEGTKITMNAFEAINEHGAVLGGEHNVLSYICREGENEYLSHVRRGFRYLLVNIPAREAEITLKNIYLFEWRYPAENRANFECSDARLCEVYKMCVDTAKVCMLDAYVDCPGYEQNIWVGDAGVTALVNLANFGCYDFDERFLSLIAGSIDEGLERVYRHGNKRYLAKKFLPCASFPTYPEGNIPIWSYMWVLSVANHYKYTGNREALASLLPAVEETFARSLGMMSARGLLSINGAWNLIEWANNDVSEYGECVANSMLLSYCFREFAKIYAALGECEKAAEYTAHGERIKAAVNKYAWNEERGAYIDTVRDEEAYAKYLEYYAEIGKEPLDFEKYMSLSRVSVQTNTFAVLYGIADGERREKALEILAENVEKGLYIAGTPANRTAGTPTEEEAPGGIVHIGSPFFMFYALGALFENGHAELALKSIAREWGALLDAGVTTCTESFNSKTEWKTRSVAHAWSASPALYMISEVLGVKPIKPGFAEFTVEPCANLLTFAKGSVPTPYGDIHVEWQRKAGGEIEISVEAPKECKRI